MSHPCAQKGCPNRYTEVIGGGGWGAKVRPGADCLPCYYAALLRRLNSTPEAVEGNARFMSEMESHLTKGGWSWQDVKRSYNREAVVR